MNSNMMNRNSMGCIGRGGMNPRNMGPGFMGGNGCGCPGSMPENGGCGRSDGRPGNNGCGCGQSDNRPENNGCGCGQSDNRPGNNGCGCMSEQQLMNMNQKQLLQYLNQVSFSMYDTVLFLDTHPTDREAMAYFHEMQKARKMALTIYQQKFAPLLIDDVDADCEWTWGMEPLPWENCE